MVVVDALAALKLGFQVVGGASNVARITKSEYDKLIVQDDASLGNVYKKPDPVKKSPIIDALINLYSQAVPQGVIYVMYAPAGQDKTFGARSLLRNFYAFQGEEVEQQNVKALMLTGQALHSDDYMSQLGDQLGATGVHGWIHALRLALDQPENLEPSLLILDGFNSLGEENVNERFIEHLYGLMNAQKNMFVVVSTSDEAVANQLCSLNGGQRVAPLPGSYEGNVTSPTWNGMNWSRDLLIEAVRFKFPGTFPQDANFDFITTGMTPLQAIKVAGLTSRSRKGLGSPRRRNAN
ncbi:hypothetical protein FRACYDRAFT_241361 [Fragilariopsis cylindrus CCMP1102]|uniref:Uncharacterized protein n=1 Tax=Fragilariopsis cylindrus CCMP1102 TaxID=635003 RepID=A0A1E7FAD1_9STRA|nr:hypothetical protein FRACYDRAFT_241361 [Fragilariopsis cylindrus CCMP1102]|eukprot:OEU14803.1 hypothetical protein FRACYDRAFT_241361 [Fragilariopsis cylindrus CCMP1102]